MPTVLVLGATGYLGLPIAQSLLRSGNYTVYGLARTPAKAKDLIKDEIIPVIGDVTDPSTFTHLISSITVDIVIDATNPHESSPGILSAVAAASKSRMAKFASEGAPNCPKLGFVYISGSWVHGSVDGPVSDLIPAGTSLSKGTPATMVSWRPAHEQAVLSARGVLDVAIIRPHMMHGRASRVWSALWGPLAEAAKSDSAETIKVTSDYGSRPGVIHVDDVVSGVHNATDRVHRLLGDWPVFDLVSEHIFIRDVMEGVKKVLGAKGSLEFVGTQGSPLFEALGLVNNNQSSRANIILGWEAKHRNFLLHLDTYVKAWAAAQEEQN